jgi:hypothetical protein
MMIEWDGQNLISLNMILKWQSATCIKFDWNNHYEYKETDLYNEEGYNLLTGEKFKVNEYGDKCSKFKIQDIEVWSVNILGIKKWKEA